MPDFKSELRKLNDAQREAVTTIDGPLLVVAGPGTGKTQLLSARAAYILINTDANPRNILCLTFTERAATNMKDRMLGLIGPDARNIVVKTFHGLGAELINTYPQYFWNAAKLQPAPEIVQREIIELVLQQRPLHDPLTLKFAGNYTLVKQILNDIGQAKKAGLTPQRLHALAATNVEYFENIQSLCEETLGHRIGKGSVDEYRRMHDELPDEGFGELTIPLHPISQVLKDSLRSAIDEAEALSKTKPLSEWKSKWTSVKAGRRVFKDEDRSRRMVALSEVYETYQEQMHGRGYFDYSDMILEVITQLQTREDFRTDVQERFSYIMIDEFQDTNDAQFRMAYLIANSPVSDGRPNVMAVGDDDQAIYRFQGAELSNVDNFTKSFKSTKEIVLTQNYRSHQSILDCADQTAQLIERRLVDSRPEMDKKIIASNPDVKKGKIRHLAFLTQAHQMSGVAEAVKDKFDAPGGGSVAVIARSHKSLERLSGILHGLNVPIRYDRRSNVMEHPIVELLADLSDLVEAIAAGKEEESDELIAKLISHPVWGAGPLEAYKLAVAMRRRSGWLSELVSSRHKPFARLGAGLEAVSKKSRELPAAIAIEYLLGLRVVDGYRFPIRDFYLKEGDDSEYVQGLSALQRLRGLVAEFSQDKQPKLEDFARFLRLNQRHGVVVSDESTFVTEDRAVELMSAHTAKGLEFDHVFIIDAIDKEWRPNHQGGKPPANLESMQQYGEDSDDYARLLFVAQTRARSDLTITSYTHSDEGRQVLSSPLIGHVEAEESTTAAEPLEVIERHIRWPVLSVKDRRQILAPLVVDYQLSVTHLLNFIDITSGGPDYFVERNLLRLPEVKTPSLAFGSAIHAGIETAHRLTNVGKLDVEEVVEAFERQLSREQIEREEEDRFREQGGRLLRELIDQQRITLEKGDQPERVLNGVRVGEAIIGGKLDVVREEGDAVRVVDYKTGKPPSSLDTISKTDGVKAYKHRLQLIFYGLLLQDADLLEPNQRLVGEMVYLESDNPARFSMEYEPSSDDIERMRRLIVAVWRHIKELDFPDIADYEKSLPGISKFEDDLLS